MASGARLSAGERLAVDDGPRGVGAERGLLGRLVNLAQTEVVSFFILFFCYFLLDLYILKLNFKSKLQIPKFKTHPT